jgi:hypothetical protein
LSNPMNVMKYLADPEMSPLISKAMSKLKFWTINDGSMLFKETTRYNRFIIEVLTQQEHH